MTQEPTDRDDQNKDASGASITFDVFETFFKNNPDLDNAEYYRTFPSVNTGTIRSWKARAKSQVKESKSSQQSTPTKQEDKSEDTYLKELVETLKIATRINPLLIKDLDLKSQLAVLKNYQAQRQPDPNLKIFTPPGTSEKKLGIEQFMRIDEKSFRETGKGTIEVRIPATKVFNPEESKKLREYI